MIGKKGNPPFPLPPLFLRLSFESITDDEKYARMLNIYIHNIYIYIYIYTYIYIYIYIFLC